MAKSSLTFLNRKNVDVLTAGDHTLVKEDCGKIIVLSSTDGQTITLPLATDAGEGWNARLVVGTQQTNRQNFISSSVRAQPSDTVTLVNPASANTLSAGTAASNDDAIDTAGLNVRAGVSQEELTKEDITITVPKAAGGSAITFKFVLINLYARNNPDIPPPIIMIS